MYLIKKNGGLISKEVKKIGFDTKIEFDAEYEDWTCYCSKKIFLDYNIIVNIEIILDKIARKYNGNIDGFGTYGNLD